MPREISQSVINQIDEFLRNEYGISLDDSGYTVYIVGSYASGDETPESDLDILFTEYPEDWIQQESLKMFEDEISIDGWEVDLHLNVTASGLNSGEPAVEIS